MKAFAFTLSIAFVLLGQTFAAPSSKHYESHLSPSRYNWDLAEEYAAPSSYLGSSRQHQASRALENHFDEDFDMSEDPADAGEYDPYSAAGPEPYMDGWGASETHAEESFDLESDANEAFASKHAKDLPYGYGDEYSEEEGY